MKIEKIDAIQLSTDDAKKYITTIINENYAQNPTIIKYLGGGSFGSAFYVQISNAEMVIKFLRAKDMLEKEVFDLTLIGENSNVKFPKVLFSRAADDIIPLDCYAMELVQGKSAFVNPKGWFLSKKKRIKFADEVTTALHNIHNKTNDKFGDTLNPEFASWIDFYKPFAKAIYEKAEEMFKYGILPSKVIFAMRVAWEKFDMIFAENVTSACLIHGDLNLANIMVDKNFNITSFIDPLNSMYADTEYDLFQFDNIGGKRFYLRKTYMDKYGASANCNVKCAFYGLWNEVFCYIKSGTLINTIMNPLVKNMYKQLKNLWYT